jgi:transglutaminase-like putative cysteine protease
LLVALVSAAMGLANTIRGLNAGLLLPLGLLGLTIGWWLAKSPLPGWLGGLIALALGIETVFLRVGRLGEPLMRLAQALVESSLRFVVFLVWGGWGVGRSGSLPDGTPILLAVEGLRTDIGTLLVRLLDWLTAQVTGRSIVDLVAVALVWGLMMWAVAAWAGWWVRRRNQPLPGMVPAGVLLSVCLFYWRGELAFLLLLLGATLLLVAFVGQDTRERRWANSSIDFPSDVGWEVKLFGAGLSLTLVSFALLVPSVSWRQMVDWAETLVRGQPRTVQVVAGPERPGVDAIIPKTILEEDQIRAPGLPRRHLLGSGPELSEQVVMVVSVEEAEQTGDALTPGPSQFAPLEPAPRYYWRSLTYNEYTGQGWITDGTELTSYPGGSLAVYRDPFEPLGVNVQPSQAIPPGRRKIRAEVRAIGELGELLYAAGDLVTVDREFQVAWRSPQDAFGATILKADQVSKMAWSQGAPTVYRTDSLVVDVGEVQLRAAGSDYPVWVQDRYLALPNQVPERVLALALDLTATEPTPFDRARAIEAYLRTYPYNLDLPPPKLDRDVVDYFLFDLRQGYCDYYATSMVVLARAAGLPARLAVGYHTGTYDQVNQRYVVVEANAHAWVEIYFPGYGWIDFEPTAGVPPIDRPQDVPPAVPAELEVLEPIGARRILVSQLWWLGLLGMVAVLVLASLARSVADGWRLSRMPPEQMVAILYQRLYRHGRRLAVSAQTGDTPFEYLASLVGRVGEMGTGKLLATVLANAAFEANWLVGLYVRTCYGPSSPDVIDRKQAMRLWRRLQRRLWLAQLFQAWDSARQFTVASSRSAHPAEHRPTG